MLWNLRWLLCVIVAHVCTFPLRPVLKLLEGDALQLALLQSRYNVSLIHGDNVHLLALGDKVYKLVPVEAQKNGKKWMRIQAQA